MHLPPTRAPARSPGAGLSSALWPLLGLVVLALVLALRGHALALLILPLSAWLGWRALAGTPRRPPPAPAAPRPPAEGLLKRLLPLWGAQIGTAQQQLNQGIEASLQSFQCILAAQEALSPRLPSDGPAREALMELASHSDGALAALQVGDRVHQMLEVIRQDQQRLSALLEHPETLDPQDTDRWLAELQARYTTQEQRDTHDGRAPAAADPAAGVQYF